MKPLTKAEEQVMQVLWKLNDSFLREIVESMPAPKPHQNTVATILKILVEKEFVGGLLGHWGVWTKKAVRLLPK